MPSVSALPDHRRKLARAEFHLQEVERLTKDWLNSKAYEVSVKPDGHGALELVGELLKPMPDSLGLVIGDALEAMRSSLDNLAFALARKNKPSMTAEEQRHVSYPIYEAPPTSASKSIRHLAPAARTDIIGLCGYPAVHAKEDDPLWLLNETNNWDKHRAITVAALDASNYRWEIGRATLVSPTKLGIGGPHRVKNVGDRNVFATFGVGSQMQAQIGHALQIVFDESLPVRDREVCGTLRWMHDHIRDTVFKALEPHL